MKQKRRSHRYVVCVKNRGFRASLEVRKVYRAIPDATAEARQLVRIVDESGEDYLYPQNYFVAVDLPLATARAISAAG
jgi:hypothetical protein